MAGQLTDAITAVAAVQDSRTPLSPLESMIEAASNVTRNEKDLQAQSHFNDMCVWSCYTKVASKWEEIVRMQFVAMKTPCIA